MIQAIETHYKGYRFRSRLEARWAVFFDTLGVKWTYEPEGFLTDAGPYLPDFYLPRERRWVEIKPNAPGDGDAARLNAFRAALAAPLIALHEAQEIEWEKIRALPEGPEKQQRQQDVWNENEPITDDLWVLAGEPGEKTYFLWPQLQRNYRPNEPKELTQCLLCRRLITTIGCSNYLQCEWCDIFDRNTGQNASVEFHKGLIMWLNDRNECMVHSSQMQMAYISARSARFEYGEHGR